MKLNCGEQMLQSQPGGAREQGEGRGDHGTEAAQYADDVQPSEESKHATKVRKQQEAWKGLLPNLKSLYLDSLGCNITRAKRQLADMQTTLQAEIDSSTCCPHCPYPQPLHRQQPDGNVWYYGLHGCFQLAMHKTTCVCCNQVSSPHALNFGCFPSSPVTAHVWYDLRVLSLYKSFGPMDGLSQTGKKVVSCQEIMMDHSNLLVNDFSPSLKHI